MQDKSLQKYIDSYEETSKQKLLNFRVLMNKGKEMTEQEALHFVYANDSSKLFCILNNVNLETEKVEGTSRELYMPKRCLKLTSSDLIIIGYASFECLDSGKPVKGLLTLLIIEPKKFVVTDTLSVYIGNEFDWEMNGIINPENNNVFILKVLNQKNAKKDAFIYSIDSKTLKFKVKLYKEGVEKMTDNLEKDLELLGWQAQFLN
jgi:hypothetical protein